MDSRFFFSRAVVKGSGWPWLDSRTSSRSFNFWAVWIFWVEFDWWVMIS